MSARENKALVRRWVEGLFNEGNLDVADEILSSNFVLHVPFDPRELRGAEAVKQFVSAYRQAYPDGHTTIEDQIAEGDQAVNRWRATGTHRGEFQGLAPTGNRAEVTGIDIVRVAGGKLVEGWVELDGLDATARGYTRTRAVGGSQPHLAAEVGGIHRSAWKK